MTADNDNARDALDLNVAYVRQQANAAFAALGDNRHVMAIQHLINGLSGALSVIVALRALLDEQAVQQREMRRVFSSLEIDGEDKDES